MKNKKLAISLLSTAVLSSMTASAFAAEEGIYFGGDVNHFYKMGAFDNTNLYDLIQDDIDAIEPDYSQIIHVDDRGFAATLADLMAADPEDDVYQEDIEAVFGDHANTEYAGTDENGDDTDPVIPIPGVEGAPVLDGVTHKVEGKKVTISGSAENVDIVTITLWDPKGDLFEEKEVEVKDGEFTFTVDELTAGEWEYEVFAENDVDSASATYNFTIDGAPVGDVAVESVSAINAKTIEVKFNQAIEDTSKVTFTVKRGSADVTLTAAFAEDKKSATLSSSSNLLAGEYIITVSGVAESAKVTVEAQQLKTIEISSDKLVLAAGNAPQTGTVSYVAKDQYGTDITKESLATDISWTSSNGTASDDNQGTVTVNKGAEIKVGDTIVITAYDKATGVSAKQTVNAVGSSTLSSFTFDGQPVVPTNATRLTAGQNDVVINYKAKNQYGNDVLLTNLNDLQFISSNDAVVDGNSFALVGGKLTFDIKSGFTKATDVTITVINKNTGDFGKVTFTVYPVADASTPVIVTPTAKLGEGGSLKVYVKVKDQFGTELTTDEIVAGNAKFQFASSNDSVFTVSGPAKDENGAFVTLNAGVGTANQSAILTFTVKATNETVTQVINIVAAKTPASMTLAPTATSVSENASATIKATFKDQYGDAVTSANNYKVKFETSDATVMDAPAEETLANMVATGKTVTAKAGSAGKSAKITAKFYKDANGNSTIDTGELVDTQEITFTVPAQSSLTYAAEPIAKLYAAGVSASATASDYKQEIKIFAKDASGNKVAIPSTAVANVTTENEDVAKVGATGGKWYVVGNGDNLLVGQTATTKLHAVVNTASGVKLVDIPVTISKENLVATSIKVLDGDTNEEITNPTYSFADATALTTGLDLLNDSDAAGKPYVRVYDQFGVAAPDLNEAGTQAPVTLSFYVSGDNEFVYTDAASDKIVVATTNNAKPTFDNAVVKLTDGGTTGNVYFKDGSDFVVTALTSNGLSKTITFKVTSGNGPVAPAGTLSYANETIAVDDTMEYSTDGGTNWTAVPASATTISVTSLLPASGTKVVKVRVKAKGNAPAGAVKTVTLDPRPATPTTPAAGTGADAGKILNVTTAMEYQKVGTTTWTACPGTEVTSLTAGDKYIIRTAATGSAFASAPTAEITIAAP